MLEDNTNCGEFTGLLCCAIMLSIENYHQNDTNNAKWYMWCLKLKQVYTHFPKKSTTAFFVKWFHIAAKIYVLI